MSAETKSQILSALALVKRTGMPKFIKYVESSDFFTAPASTRFHGSNAGGLAEHSWNVYTIFKDKVAHYKLELSEESVILCSLLHDICKIGVYRKGKKNVKEDGKWIEKEVWEYNDGLPFGHGEKSVYILQKYIELTDEEAIIIRWHMGLSEPKELWRKFDDAAEIYPAAVALFTSDVEAAHLIEGQGAEST
jgi:hypothetical protein